MDDPIYGFHSPGNTITSGIVDIRCHEATGIGVHDQESSFLFCETAGYLNAVFAPTHDKIHAAPNMRDYMKVFFIYNKYTLITMQNHGPFLFLLFLAIAAGIPFFGLVGDESATIIFLDVRLPRSPAGVLWTPEVPHVEWLDQSADDPESVMLGCRDDSLPCVSDDRSQISVISNSNVLEFSRNDRQK